MGTPILGIPNKKLGLKPSKIIKIGSERGIRTLDLSGMKKVLISDIVQNIKKNFVFKAFHYL